MQKFKMNLLIITKITMMQVKQKRLEFRILDIWNVVITEIWLHLCHLYNTYIWLIICHLHVWVNVLPSPSAARLPASSYRRPDNWSIFRILFHCMRLAGFPVSTDRHPELTFLTFFQLPAPTLYWHVVIMN